MNRLSLLRKPGRGRVLVVNGDDTSSKALQLIVAFDGHDVRRAADASQALGAIDEFRPHVVLLDAAPLDAERALCGELAERAERAHTSIILTSPPRTRLDRRLRRWAVATVTRPFDFMELRLLISREVGRAEL